MGEGVQNKEGCWEVATYLHGLQHSQKTLSGGETKFVMEHICILLTTTQ